jgi:hypothetical protein
MPTLVQEIRGCDTWLMDLGQRCRRLAVGITTAGFNVCDECAENLGRDGFGTKLFPPASGADMFMSAFMPSDYWAAARTELFKAFTDRVLTLSVFDGEDYFTIEVTDPGIMTVQHTVTSAFVRQFRQQYISYPTEEEERRPVGRITNPHESADGRIFGHHLVSRLRDMETSANLARQHKAKETR